MNLKRLTWLSLSSLVVLLLILTSCGQTAPEQPATPTEVKGTVSQPTNPTTATTPPTKSQPTIEATAGANTVTLNLTKLDGSKVTKVVEKPKYGGRITTSYIHYNENWDPRGAPSYVEPITHYNIYQTLMIPDWTRGPAGTGENDFLSTYIPAELFVPSLAESYEMPNPKTHIFHLRKGVRFQNKAPANGREVTADDWVYSITEQGKVLTGASIRTVQGDKISATDKYTLVIETANVLLDAKRYTSYMHWVFPPEIVNKTTNKVDWKDTCGTGPYILAEYVSASWAKLVKNKDFVGNDPLFPENKLPYVDEVMALFVPDQATRLAGLRTGKLDRMNRLTPEEAQQINKSNPEILQAYGPGFVPHWLWLRADLKPFSDIRVRQALAMAIDRQAISKGLYLGKTDLPCVPLTPGSDAYTALKDLPQDMKALYEYNPEKAKQLLKDAGYPTGFKIETPMLVNSQTGFKDEALVIKDNWEKVGVLTELNLQPAGVITSLNISRKYETYLSTMGGGQAPDWIVRTSPFSMRSPQNNYWGVDDKNLSTYYDAETDKLQTTIRDTADPAQRMKLLKELNLFLMRKAYIIDMPLAYTYNVWQPWFKGYYGTSGFGQNLSYEGIYWFCWIDQDLKFKMTGVR